MKKEQTDKQTDLCACKHFNHVYDWCRSYILRNFLRLGNPLNCSLNDITVEDLNKIFVDGACLKSADNSGEVPLANEKATDENEGSGTANQIAPYGGSLSLARIQSLVSMTTPRYGFQMGMMAILHLLSLISLLTALGASSFQVFPQNIGQADTAGG